MKKHLLASIISLIITSACYSQQIGEWTVHSPGMKVIDVNLMQGQVFAATQYDVFFVNTYDNSINRLTKTNGLSDFGVKAIRHDSGSGMTFIGYSNTNIDIIDRDGDIFNIPDIKNKNILGNKTINNAIFFNGKIYVCCGFGIVVIDLKKMEVSDTYIIGENSSYLNVNDLTVYNGKFYAATSEGVFFADANNPNLVDCNQWTFDESMPYPLVEYRNIETFGNSLIANGITNGLYDETFIFDGTEWKEYLPDERYIHKQIRACGERLLIVNDTVITTTSGTSQQPKNIKVFNIGSECIKTIANSNLTSAIYDEKHDCYWIGTDNQSLARYNSAGKYEYFKIDGPYSNYVFDLKSEGRDVWVASGGYSSTWANHWRNDGVFHYDGEKWSYVSGHNSILPYDFYDASCTAPVPGNGNKVYIGSYYKGIALIDNNKRVALYDEKNSTLGYRTAALPSKYVCVTGMDFDSKGTLWVANSGAEKLISSMTSSGVWTAYNIGNQGGDVSRLMVDDNDIVWLLTRQGQAIVFDGKTHKTVNNDNTTGGLPGNSIKCFTIDRNGTVWIGTDNGVAMFYNSNKIFQNSSFSCSQILVPRNDGTGQADYLLSGLTINCIAADGANKMWFGTNNGVFYISNDGLTQHHHFTTENSPLLSNNIENITIDSDGIVYFSTENGLISYRGTATPGGKTNSDVLVFPNPVRQDYSGVIGIKGLVEDALVKITTTSGAFVTHLRAEGGQAVWDRTDIKGRRVEPGIYIIFASDSTGKETYCTKVLIM
ncbi:MAG: hypothetical protein MJZ90_04985 [Bacteroidales bacterium]|nr:hypothetical protein [Bacteroidales bacterium]